MVAMTVGLARLKPLHRTNAAERRGDGRGWRGENFLLLLVVFFLIDKCLCHEKEID